MKMIYQPKHTSHKQNFSGNVFVKRLAIFLALLICILIFNLFDSARSLMTKALSPLAPTGNYFYGLVSTVIKNFSDKNSLIAENQELRANVENLRLNALTDEAIRSENEQLRQDLLLKPVGNFLAAKITAKPPQIPLDSLLIDRGAADGLNSRDFVLAADKVLIGRIVKINGNTSVVALSSFSGEVSFGFIDRTNEPLEIKGNGSGSMQAKVPINFDIIVGDKIMLGSGNTYLVGLVGVIEENHSSGFKDILISLPVNVSKISTVFIESFINE